MIYIIYSIIIIIYYIYHDPESAIFKGETNGEIGSLQFSEIPQLMPNG